MNKVDKNYKDFWKPIFGFRGLLNFKQVKKELSDFYFLIKEVPKVYYEITDGLISKANTYSFEVMSIYNQILNERYVDKEELKYIIKNYSGKELKKQLKELTK